ncbi:hypothetical protein SAMN05428988_2935 [Chitinophaga sp. YR573]|uniref:hypothetical protein n=1 Tax=Chitinophaga sp. YR573 TaxID=1881040 RepID=UPI0008B5D163|nr:hypothetical protein [Chitinophaga sp. YR573]SEW19065.1 hypothetical protein SAMN05428988_2935 [Chitinophaga sp. YR573]
MNQENPLVANLSTPASNIQQPNNTTSASIAGASGGTLLVLLANNLPESYPLKSWLVIIAPSVSIVLSLFWKFLSKKTNIYFKGKKVEKSKTLLQKKIQAALNNGLISQEEAIVLKRKMIEIELQSIDNLANKIKSIDFED